MEGMLKCGAGLALCLVLVGCSSQYDAGCCSADVNATETLPEEDRNLDEKEKLMKEMVGTRTPVPIEGTLVHYEEFPTELIRPRPVDVWLPEGYDPASSDRYPVIYMHDGQMMFDHSTSPYAGMDLFWDVDKAITRLVRDGEIRPAIVVSIWMADWAKGAREPSTCRRNPSPKRSCS